MRAGLQIWDPNVDALEGAGEQDAIRLHHVLQEPRARGPIGSPVELAAGRPHQVHETSLLDRIRVDLPPMAAPDQIVQPKDPDVVIVEPTHYIGAADLT